MYRFGEMKKLYLYMCDVEALYHVKAFDILINVAGGSALQVIRA
jgi:hypothetical protein